MGTQSIVNNSKIEGSQFLVEGSLFCSILTLFGVPLGSFLWCLGVLGMGWNFDVFWDLPWGVPGFGTSVSRWLNVTPRGPANSHQQQLADLKPAIGQDTKPADRQLQRGCQKLDNSDWQTDPTPSQPGGPQGAGGFVLSVCFFLFCCSVAHSVGQYFKRTTKCKLILFFFFIFLI